MIKPMFRWLKRHFVPHEGNNHRPHFLHRHNAKQLVGVALMFELILFILPVLNITTFLNTLNMGAVLPGILSGLTNTERLAQSLPELQESEVLNRAAQMKAEDMAAKSYFAHTSPEGRTPWYWLQQVGYGYSYAGENLAVNFIDSQDVTQAWMNSPTHRANIVHGSYTEVGTGVATGMYQGYETVFVAQVYGRPNTIVPVIERREGEAGSSVRIASEPSQAGLSVRTTEPAAAVEQVVLGEAQTNPTGINQTVKQTIKKFLQEAAASPRHTTDAMLYSVMAVITLALLFNIFVKIKHQHPDLIFNGAMAMVVILGLHVANIYIAEEQSLQTTFIAYDSEERVIE